MSESLQTNALSTDFPVVAFPSPDGHVLASKARRFTGFLIDLAGSSVAGFIFGIAVALLFDHKGLALMNSLPSIIIGIPVTFAYYFILEGSTGRTLGKLVCGTKVVDIGGLKVGPMQIAKRSLCRLIPFDAISFLGDRGWHDSLSKTYVVLSGKRS